MPLNLKLNQIQTLPTCFYKTSFSNYSCIRSRYAAYCSPVGHQTTALFRTSAHRSRLLPNSSPSAAGSAERRTWLRGEGGGGRALSWQRGNNSGWYRGRRCDPAWRGPGRQYCGHSRPGWCRCAATRCRRPLLPGWCRRCWRWPCSLVSVWLCVTVSIQNPLGCKLTK